MTLYFLILFLLMLNLITNSMQKKKNSKNFFHEFHLFHHILLVTSVPSLLLERVSALSEPRLYRA